MLNLEADLDVAVLVLESGGSTKLAEKTLNNLRKTDEPAEAVWRSDFVALSVTPEGLPRTTIVRSVGTLGLALFRASEAALLGERAARGDVDRNAIAGEVARIRNLASPYSRWITRLAVACAAAFFTQTAGGDYGALGIAFVAAAFGQFVRTLPRLRKVPRTGNVLIAAMISALIGTAGLRLGLAHGTAATLLGSIIYLIPGLSLANGFVDLVSDGHMLVGFERLLHAGFTFLILTTALVVADALL